MKEKQKKGTPERQALPIFNNDTVILEGRTGVTVYGCKKILTYGDTEILLQVGNGLLKLIGRRLGCTSFCGGALTVYGKIDGVFYPDSANEGENI